MNTNLVTSNFPLLSSDNFSNWKFRIKTLLEEKQVADTLDKDIDPITDEDQKQLFKKQDAKAKTTIVQCLTDKHLDLVKDSKTAKQMMTVLENVFERKSVFTKLYLKRKLLSMKCEPNERLEDHFLKFDNLMRELESAGSKIDESDKVCHLLLTMNPIYDPVITAIETLQNEITIEFVKSRLLDEELKLSNKKPNSLKVCESEVTFKAQNDLKCYGCGKTNHKYADCWYRNKSNHRGRGNRGRSGFNKGQYFTRKKENANKANTDITFIANHCTTEEDIDTFIVDSGATEHLVKSELEPYMINIQVLSKKILIKTANGDSMIAEKVGEFQGKCQGMNINFQALIVQQMNHNYL